MTEPGAVVSAVNVGVPREVEYLGKTVTTAIWKSPVEGPVRLEGVNLVGDDQADRRVHGGPDKAVYAYATEDYDWWRTRIDAVEDGAYGENLTTAGLDLRDCRIGDRWHVGTAVLEVSQPRSPCFKLGIRMADREFPLRFIEAERPGTYLRIIEAGEVRAGDAIVVRPTYRPSVRVGDLARSEIPLATLQLAAADERVPEGWRRSAAQELERRGEDLAQDAVGTAGEVSAGRG